MADSAGDEFDANEFVGKIGDDKKAAYSKGAVQRVKSDNDTRVKRKREFTRLINQANKIVSDGLNRVVDEIKFSEYECCSCSKGMKQYGEVYRCIAIDDGIDVLRRCLLCKRQMWLTSSRHYRIKNYVRTQRATLDKELKQEKKHNKKNGKRKRV